MRLRVVASVLALLVASTAVAQDTVEDWEVARVPERDTIIVASRFDNGMLVGVRCIGTGLEVLISGLPLASRGSMTRIVDYAFGDDALRPSSWWVSEDRDSIFADFPAGMARQLRDGGRLQLRFAGEGGQPARRYIVEVPPSPALVDEVLTACDRPLSDPRDGTRSEVAETVPLGLRWEQSPRPEYPSRAIDRRISGAAVISCVGGLRGRLEDCEVESERPSDAGFGRAALRAMRDARLRTVEQENPDITGREVAFTVNFTMR